MLVRVQTPDGQVRVEVQDSWTLADFKRAVEKACAVQTWDQEFSRDIAGRQKIPDDGRSLRSLNVTCVLCSAACARPAAASRRVPRQRSLGRALRLTTMHAAVRRHGEQLYLNDLSKSVAVYTAEPAAGAPAAAAAAAAAAPRARPRVAPAAAPLRPQADAARETTSPPIDPRSAPAASPLSASVQGERRRERKMAPMPRMGAPPPMAAAPAGAGGGAEVAADWEMDM
jgi:hypothetical protein